MKHLSSLLLALACAAPSQAQTALTFTARAPLPDGGRYAMGYCQDQSYFYMVGGGSPATAFTSQVYRYDPAANSWGTGPLSTGQVPDHRLGKAVLLPDGTNPIRLYVLQGATSAGPMTSMSVLNATTGQAIATSTGGTVASNGGTATWNGLLYSFGGVLANGAFTNELRRFDPATRIWTSLAPMPEAKSAQGAAVNGKIYVLGGFDGAVNSNRIDAYDIATNQWQTLAPLPTTVSNQALVVQGEWLWMIGDFTAQTYLTAYNTRTGQLRTFTSNLPGRRNAAAAILNNQLYVWGGNTAASNASTLADMWQANISNILPTAAPARLPQLTAYPNPSPTGEFTLQLPAGSHRVVEVHDALGRLILRATPAPQTESYTLRLTPYPAGLYSARIRTTQGLTSPCQLVRP
ncbi:T9SS C-terminal target domain-containing protein [Hymenobacter chitinivorans]|uniref:Putative secreted protein (Por secretion system target) n=1 Tax=Hymenobacter chitinivorans DSM 11115 TaxID=1121954 RepID=A0A2M9BSW8_9BACT|nr:T9SS C-terminal target domain-containing protein [Hymenobacter chitinivorans]PJJ61027.1 putative secreted protein (Por secretion system target) [Hymenobacter chitinivorans DSM 11115]